MATHPRNHLEAAKLSEGEARDLFERIRYPDRPVFPYCGGDGKRLEGKSHRAGLHKCQVKGCRKQFTVTTKTPLHGIRIPLNKWIAAIYSMSAHRKVVSALQMQRDLGLGCTGRLRTCATVCERL